jgi:hypothetical protein
MLVLKRNERKEMSIIVTIKERDMWEGIAPVIERAKFIEEGLMTFEGSMGFGGVESRNPMQSAKDWAIVNKCDSDIHGFYMEVIDTQSPAGSNSHKREYAPILNERNDFIVEWVLQ